MPVTFYQIIPWLFILVGFCIFHAVFFCVAFNLTVAKHWKARHSNHKSTAAKIFITITKLSNCSLFIRIVHKVYITFKNLWVKGDCIFYSLSVFLVFFFFKHVHKSRIVNTMHTKSTNKVTFHHPEGFC